MRRSTIFPSGRPTARRIVFRSNRTGPGDLYQKLTSGAGVEERLVASDQVKIPTSWSADGRFLLYHSIDPQTSTDLWVVPMVGDRTPSVFLKTPFRETLGRVLAGRPVGGLHVERIGADGDLRAAVCPARRGRARPRGGWGPVAGVHGGRHLSRWRPDGKELYYLNPAGAMMAAPITVTGSTLEPGAPVVLFPTRIFGGGVDAQQGRQYDVAPDGRFLINTVLDERRAPITLLQNWNPEGTR